MVPLTVSLATIFTPDSFAKNLQNGTDFYILEVQGNFTAFKRFIRILVKPPDSVLAALGDISNTKRPEEALV